MSKVISTVTEKNYSQHMKISRDLSLRKDFIKKTLISRYSSMSLLLF